MRFRTPDIEDKTKRKLEIEKLALEHKILQYQTSFQGKLIEWLKASSVPVALLGAVLAFFVGYNELRQTAETKDIERFDRNLARLSSEKPDERIGAISNLNFFLHRNHNTLQSDTIQAAINSISVEENTQVQGALLDLLSEIKSYDVDPKTLNAALDLAVKRNRTLTKSITSTWDHREEKSKINYLNSSGNKITGRTLPMEVISKLTLDQYLSIIELQGGPFDNLPPEEEVPLRGLARAIEILIDIGAQSKEFKNIFCENCDFRAAEDLSDAKFDGSFLARADFSHVVLQKASFKGADVSHTSFFSTDLSGADFRAFSFEFTRDFPDLECATLYGADLSGIPLAMIRDTYNTIYAGDHAREISVPGLYYTKIDNKTKIDEFRILIYVSVSDEYLKKNPNEEFPNILIKDREFSMMNDLMVDNRSYSGILRRRRADSFADPSKWNSTTFMYASEIDVEEVARLSQSSSIFSKYLEQQSFKEIPLINKFNEKLNSMSHDNTTVGSAAAKYNPPSCASEEKIPYFGLRISSGQRSVTSDDN